MRRTIGINFQFEPKVKPLLWINCAHGRRASRRKCTWDKSKLNESQNFVSSLQTKNWIACMQNDNEILYPFNFYFCRAIALWAADDWGKKKWMNLNCVRVGDWLALFIIARGKPIWEIFFVKVHLSQYSKGHFIFVHIIYKFCRIKVLYQWHNPSTTPLTSINQ